MTALSLMIRTGRTITFTGSVRIKASASNNDPVIFYSFKSEQNDPTSPETMNSSDRLLSTIASDERGGTFARWIAQLCESPLSIDQ